MIQRLLCVTSLRWDDLYVPGRRFKKCRIAINFLPLAIVVVASTNAFADPRLGLPSQKSPGRAGEDPGVVTLGKKLFFDTRLSADRKMSCATCHVPEEGFTQNNISTAMGSDGQRLKRNAPTLLNISTQNALFHDGRESSLENQVWSPLLSEQEMGNKSAGELLNRIASLDDYREQFDQVPGSLDMKTLGIAIAAFERTLVAADSPFDQWFYHKVEGAISNLAIEGFAVFNRHGCSNCHLVDDQQARFEDGLFHNTGIGFDQHQRAHSNHNAEPSHHASEPVDLGRFEFTGLAEDRWRYRTPTLRNIELTAPYMHDGSQHDLKTVIAYYSAGGFNDKNQDPRLLPFAISENETEQLIAFLHSLTSRHITQLIQDARASLNNMSPKTSPSSTHNRQSRESNMKTRENNVH